MTNAFTIGEPIENAAESVPLGQGRATATAQGLQIVVRVEAPDLVTCATIERGQVGLGFHHSRDGFVFLLNAGVPGEPGHLEARAEADFSADDDDAPFDTELALCDETGVVRAIRRFEGLLAPSSGGRS